MNWTFRGYTIVGFKMADPRVFMSCVLIVYTILGQSLLSFDHSWFQILVSLVVACVADVLSNYRKTRQIILPISGVITGLGLGVLIESTALWPYIVAPLLAIASKFFIKIKREHIFNPSNFGLIILVLLFPSTITTVSSQWTGTLTIVGIIFLIGCFSAYRVNRLDLVISFIGGFCIMALIEEIIKQSGFALVYGPLLGAGLQLFTLSMITDPKTTPKTRTQRIIFGLAIALIDGLLRDVNNQYSQFIALFIVSACFPLYQFVISTIQARQSQAQQQLQLQAVETERALVPQPEKAG
ncbi:MAG TPA: RnfABCDGE type electron transport complex subunit D [Ktedonobacteraceae bacterium]|nr:RnfABCDGE type electron transport complex subunit D [Ktedonobacteraceae bacterium]